MTARSYFASVPFIYASALLESANSIVNSSAAIKYGNLTDEEKELIEAGEEARVWLEVAGVDESTIASKDKAKVEKEAEKIAGENAEEKRIKNKTGNATFRTDLIDAVFNITTEEIKEKMNYEIFEGTNS